MRWGRDAEERAACVQKAHDAYATARQAMDRATGAEAMAEEAQAAVGMLSAEVAALRHQIQAMLDVQADKPIIEAVARRASRKAA